MCVLVCLVMRCHKIAAQVSSDLPVQQVAYLNIPAYRLSVYTQYADGQWEQLAFKVGVGRGVQRKDQTPSGQGELYAKATGVTFEYGPQNPAELVGKPITHSNTFDKATLQPLTIKMPRDMKSVFMKITSDLDGRSYSQYVLHETTDWYTIGTPSSNGCIRFDRDDMHRLYQTLAPTVSEGNFATPIQIISYYDVAEYYPEHQKIVLHANIYNRQIDYVREVLSDLNEAGLNTQLMNMAALSAIIGQAEAQFEQAIATIRTRLRQSAFQRFIHEHEKQQLHFTFYLQFQY